MSYEAVGSSAHGAEEAWNAIDAARSKLRRFCRAVMCASDRTMIGAYLRFCRWVGVLPRWHALGLVCAWAGGVCLGYTHFGTRPVAQLEIPGQIFGVLVLVPSIQAMHAQSEDAEARDRGYWEKSVRIWVASILSFFLMFAGIVFGQLLSPA